MDKIVHFEIPADDTERAKKFYKKTFGWEIQDMPEFNYHILRTVEVDENRMPKESGAINGGMMKRQDPVKSPVLTISVENIDEAAEKVKASGGQIIKEKIEVGEMGWSAYFKDTEGNILGLWQNKNPK